MSWVITGSQPFPAVIGEAFGGGYFAGYISHTADGNPTHALIVAPRATGATGTGYALTTNLQWKTTNTTTAGTASTFDGAANTAAMVTAGIADHPAANFCVGLNIGGFTDWYFPSRDELDIAFFNLKPTTATNSVGSGVNQYSVPRRTSGNTATYPALTFVTAFTTSQEQFSLTAGYHWSSGGDSPAATTGIIFNMLDGNRFNNPRSIAYAVRAFRRIAL